MISSLLCNEINTDGNKQKEKQSNAILDNQAHPYIMLMPMQALLSFELLARMQLISF